MKLSGATLLSGAAVNLSQTLINSGGTAIVGSGGFADETTVLKGGREIVGSGGVASGNTITGVLAVSAGGQVLNTSLEGGSVATVDGRASATEVISGARLTVGSGGMATATNVFAHGTMSIGAGGVASETSVLSSGSLVVRGGLEVHGLINATETVFAGGVTSDTHVVSGLQQLRGGESFGTVLVGNPSIPKNSAILVGEQEVLSGGVAVGTVTNAHSIQLIRSGGVSSDTQANADSGEQVLKGGLSIDTVLNKSGFESRSPAVGPPLAQGC